MSIQFQPARFAGTRPTAPVTQTNASRAASNIRFGDSTPETPSPPDKEERAGWLQKFSLGERFKAAFSKDGLISDTKWAVAFSVAGLILPGSQIALIPAAYAIGMTLRFLGMR